MLKTNWALLDIHPGNLLLGAEDDSFFEKLEESEMKNPVPRKTLSDRTIYSSRLVKPGVGPFLLSDFGEARLGSGPHAGDIQPITYRAPEALLWIQWSYAVDIWSVGLTVSCTNMISRHSLQVLTGIRHGIYWRADRCSVLDRSTAATLTVFTSRSS